MSTVLVSTVVLGAQSPDFERGELVRLRPTTNPSETRTTLPLKVVAVPGDLITSRGEAVLINGIGITDFSPEFVARLARTPRVPHIVPAGHLVVMGERRIKQDISEYWGLHPATELESFGSAAR